VLLFRQIQYTTDSDVIHPYKAIGSGFLHAYSSSSRILGAKLRCKTKQNKFHLLLTYKMAFSLQFFACQTKMFLQGKKENSIKNHIKLQHQKNI
jgi:hypothetical protein